MKWNRLAPAKINLMLQVVGRLTNGYHHLQSLIAFTQYGDQITVTSSLQKEDMLALTGSFAAQLENGEPNSILQAKKWFYHYFCLPEQFFQISLEKNLPVSAGIGGGTSDAAAMIAGLIKAHHLPLTLEEKQQLVIASGELGADVPVCLAFQLGLGNLFWIEGTGATSLPHSLPLKENIEILLFNPGIAVNTAKIFQTGNLSFSEPLEQPIFNSLKAMLTFLSVTRNDLQMPARHIYPSIPDFLQMHSLFDRKEYLIRQSGSGATYFIINYQGQPLKSVTTYLEKNFSLKWQQLTRLSV